MVEYQVLAVLSEAPQRTLRGNSLAVLTNASLSRLSHPSKRLEGRAWCAASLIPRRTVESTSDIRFPSQLHQTGAQAMEASTSSVFVTESSWSQALMAPANPCATNCAMT